jgi:hypothetical protein
MSDADAENAAEASEDVAEEQAEPDDDRPGIEAEETADLDAIREEVAAETTPAPSDVESEADGDGEDAPADSDGDADGLADAEDTAGDFYVNTLVSTSNMLIDQHGRDGADHIDGGMLRQMGVDEAVDELLAEDGQPDMPPEQQVLLGTTVFGVAVLATKTTVFDQALENSDLDLSD